MPGELIRTVINRGRTDYILSNIYPPVTVKPLT